MSNELTKEEYYQEAKVASPLKNADIEQHRLKYGLREATEEEIENMTDEVRWHYNAARYKPHGLHFQEFRHEGKVVRPVYLTLNGEIGLARGKRKTIGEVMKAGLRPLPVVAEQKPKARSFNKETSSTRQR